MFLLLFDKINLILLQFFVTWFILLSFQDLKNYGLLLLYCIVFVFVFCLFYILDRIERNKIKTSVINKRFHFSKTKRPKKLQ